MGARLTYSEFCKHKHASLFDLSPSIHFAKQHIASPKPGKGWCRYILDFELVYILRGKLRVQIGAGQYECTPGQLIYFPAGVFHDVELDNSSFAECLAIHFDYFNELDVVNETDMVVRPENASEALTVCFEPLIDHRPIFNTPIIEPPIVVIPLMKKIIDEFNRKDYGHELACQGYLLQLFTVLMRHRSTNHPKQAHSKYYYHIIKIRDAIEQSYFEEWSLSRMAKMINLHEDYMSKIFKEVLGISPSKFVQSVRHQEAKRLLRDTDLKIETISRMVGYANFHYFSRLFHELEGRSPRSYRKLLATF